MFDLIMSSRRAKLVLLFGIISISISSFRLGATGYQGISTTNPGAAIFYTALKTASSGDSFTGFIGFGGGLKNMSGGDVTVGSVGRLDTCLYASWPASIILSDDLECNSIFRCSGGSAVRFYGNGYTLRLTGSIGFDSGTNLTALSNLVVDGQGNTMTLSGDAALIYDSPVSVTLRNMTLVLKAQYPFCPLNTGSSLTLENVKVVLSAAFDTYYALNPSAFHGTGLFTIEKNVRFVGPGATFVYNSPQTMSLAPGATLGFETNTALRYLPGAVDKFYMSDQTSKLRFNNSTLNVPTAYGMQLKKGMVEFDNKVFIENGGQSVSTNGLILGDGISTANNVAVNILSGAYVIVDGVMYYNQA